MKQQSKPSWFQQIFCGCVREEPSQQQNNRLQRLSSNMSISKSKPVTLISNQQQSEGWLKTKTSYEINYMKEDENEIDSDDEGKIYNRQLSYLQKESLLQRTSFSDEFNSNTIEMRLLHKYGGLLAKQTTISVEQSSNQWIMKIYKDVQLILDREFELKFKQQLINQAIIDSLNNKIKSNQILLAHDPTGSILLKLASPSRKIYYLQSDPTFQQIIDRGVCKLKVNVEKILKMDIITKLDVVVVNLFYIDASTNLKNIFYEYSQYANDLIIILSPLLDNALIYNQIEQALLLTEQSNLSCSIELQNLIENNQTIAKIIYFGDVSEISQNDEINFIYSCIDSQIKKQFNYKLLLRDLRNQLGITKLVKSLNDHSILQGSGSFPEFVRSLVGCIDKYRVNGSLIKQPSSNSDQKIEKSESPSSSTESEPEESENQQRSDYQSESLNKSVISFSNPPILRHANSQPFNM